MLHIVKSLEMLEQASRLYSEGDTLLLIEDAIYASSAKHKQHQLITSCNTCVLEEDLAARGYLDFASESCKIVNYVGFVNLTAEHDSSVTWG
ncbi:sulfurtransferase complex subunit TusB [Vibrio mexicanus]|uniref:sulfurtransferase complex subunit TusB n=1 Tax=Vibrio mexicanus TaxID=1004326 RepID=UPI00063CB2F4|nr:sulfurtransferase complex subunit TusB [Vibrio mexicanus]